MAIGGTEDKEAELEVLGRVPELVPEATNEVTVIATASAVPDEVLPVYDEAFRRLGASEVHRLPVSERRDAGNADGIALIRRSGIVFFTGGGSETGANEPRRGRRR